MALSAPRHPHHRHPHDIDPPTPNRKRKRTDLDDGSKSKSESKRNPLEAQSKHHRHEPKSKHIETKSRHKRDDIEALQTQILSLDPTTPPTAFVDLPLSQASAAGLRASHFKTLTSIQQRAIPLALQGRDVLGAAKTGSGKTLAFLLPVLETLIRARWTELDGLGALILSPTRELAIQTFEVLRQIGRYHSFSAGLVIGGKNLIDERERLSRMHILVATPGRILQHLDQTAHLGVDQLQVLVLDEADRILDLGFQGTIDAILAHLPRKRQTLLFSATQTQRVSDLARLSLQDPEYVSVHEQAASATPARLAQHYVRTPLPDKLDVLWSFLRSNVKAKILVFFATGKQVRFVYEVFRHLQPGIPLLHLLGRQKQSSRLAITRKFASAQHSCLFATDVVARGMDFPAVDWVLQVDCPEDADTYIHRVGRTARYERDGRAVLFLEPSEEAGMLKRLETKKVPIASIKIRPKKQLSIKSQMQHLCFKDPQLKYLAQTAFVAYVRSVHVQKDRQVFDVAQLPLDDYCQSLGLPGRPNVTFKDGGSLKGLKNRPRDLEAASGDEDDEPSKDQQITSDTAVRTRYDRMFERQNQSVLAPHYSRMIEGADNGAAINDASDDEDAFLNVRRRLAHDTPVDLSREEPTNAQDDDDTLALREDSAYPPKLVALSDEQTLVIDSKRREKLLKSKKQLLKFKERGGKVVFDDDGTAHPIYELDDGSEFARAGSAATQRAQFVAKERERTQMADADDKAVVREKRRAKKERVRERERQEAAEEDDEGEETQVFLAPYNGDDLDHDHEGDSDYDNRKGKHRGRRKGRWSDGEDVDDSGQDSTPEEGDGIKEAMPSERPLHWFEKPGKATLRRQREAEELEGDLEGLEAMATRYLA